MQEYQWSMSIHGLKVACMQTLVAIRILVFDTNVYSGTSRLALVECITMHCSGLCLTMDSPTATISLLIHHKKETIMSFEVCSPKTTLD